MANEATKVPHPPKHASAHGRTPPSEDRNGSALSSSETENAAQSAGTGNAYGPTIISDHARVWMGNKYNATHVFPFVQAPVDPDVADAQDLLQAMQNLWRTYELKRYQEGRSVDKRQLFPFIENIFSEPSSRASTDSDVWLSLHSDLVSHDKLAATLEHVAECQREQDSDAMTGTQVQSKPEQRPRSPGQHPLQTPDASPKVSTSKAVNTLQDEVSVGTQTAPWTPHSSSSTRSTHQPLGVTVTALPEEPMMPDQTISSTQALSSEFQVQRYRDFFCPGRVFAILWHEPAGQPQSMQRHPSTYSQSRGPAVATGPRGSEVYSHIRRMVAIRSRKGYCWCLSINTYRGQGLRKYGLSQSEIAAHAIIFDAKRRPMMLEDESQPSKRSIAVHLVEGETVSSASRLDTGRPFSVDYNVRVKNLGMVIPDDIPTLTRYAEDELMGGNSG